MRSIKHVLQGNEKVWVYLGEHAQLKETFANDLQQLGFTFADGEPVTKEALGPVISVRADGTIAHVSMMAWTAAFQPGDGSCRLHHNFSNIPKIVYEDFLKSY